MSACCIIRVRGGIGVRKDVKDTMSMLRLTRVNHCVVVQNSPSVDGMLHKAKDYITWGKISTETLAGLIEKRGRLSGDAPITEEYLKGMGFDGFVSLAKAIEDGSIDYSELEGVKPVFRLSPPKKGYEGRKRSVKEKGSLGQRESVDDLINRMV
jgi:large subunit ribosomal protein L30